MSGPNISKVERVYAPGKSQLFAELKLNKNTGTFFSVVGNEHVWALTKEEAVKKTRLALTKVATAEWRPVIVLRVKKRQKDDEEWNVHRRENEIPVLGASCTFTYSRRERAKNPLNKKERIERSYTDDFESAIAEHRKLELRSHSLEGKEARKKRADEVERGMRERRDTIEHVNRVWEPGENEVDYELPYSAEAWAGLERIAKALRETQTKLDAFVREATPEKLFALAAGGDVFRLLPAKRSSDG